MNLLQFLSFATCERLNSFICQCFDSIPLWHSPGSTDSFCRGGKCIIFSKLWWVILCIGWDCFQLRTKIFIVSGWCMWHWLDTSCSIKKERCHQYGSCMFFFSMSSISLWASAFSTTKIKPFFLQTNWIFEATPPFTCCLIFFTLSIKCLLLQMAHLKPQI